MKGAMQRMTANNLASDDKKPIVLGICTANRCRSQLFEAIWKHLGDDQYRVISAGHQLKDVHPLLKQVLEEIGIQIKTPAPKKISDIDIYSDILMLENAAGKTLEVPVSQIRHVFTLCNSARDFCPPFPLTTEQDHWPIADPDDYAHDPEALLSQLRLARDRIYQYVEQFLAKQPDLTL